MTNAPDESGLEESGLPDVDVIVPMRNEEPNIARFAAMLRAQTLKPRRIIVADGMSEDDSVSKLKETGLADLLVVENPSKTVSSGLNAALKHANSPLTARMDLHAVYAPTYLQEVVGFLHDHPEIAAGGGSMAAAGRGPWGRAIASVLSRPFGLGGSRHRIGGRAGAVQHVFCPCYRTQVLRELDGWDERFLANEDFELDVRVGKRGSTLWLVPAATTTWFVRESPSKMSRQMFRYGYYKALTLWLHPASFRVRQAAPAVLVVALVGFAWRPSILRYLLGPYLLTSTTLGIRAARKDGASACRSAFIPPIVHVSWGSGLLVGLVRFAPPWRPPHRPASIGHVCPHDPTG